MKRREISLLLAGFLLFMIPMQMQATIALPDIVSTKQINFNKSITENIQNVTELDVTQDSADAWTVAQAASSTQSEAGQIPADSIHDVLGDSVGSASIFSADKTVEDYKLAYERAKNANWGYTNLGIANVSDNLNIRAVAAEDGKLVGKLPKDAACEVLDTDDTWAHIKSGSVEGYVSPESLSEDTLCSHIPLRCRT